MNRNIDMLDIITVVSFMLQLQNNSELRKQTTNDEVIEKLHNDIVNLLEENRTLCTTIIEQNDKIISMLGGIGNAQNNGNEPKTYR